MQHCSPMASVAVATQRGPAADLHSSSHGTTCTFAVIDTDSDDNDNCETEKWTGGQTEGRAVTVGYF